MENLRNKMKIKPDLACNSCFGTGIVYVSIEDEDCGDILAKLPCYCNCVEEQIPENNKEEIELDLTETFDDDIEEDEDSEYPGDIDNILYSY